MAKELSLTREKAWEIFLKYNRDPFHVQHALTAEGVMRWYAKELGYADEEEFWGIAGLLHDIDFEEFPEEHCVKARELLETEFLKAGFANEELIHAVCCHGHGQTGASEEPQHLMEKVLYASDELTGLIWASAIIRPSKSVMDLELKSVMKKFKTLNFAAGCNRNVIEKGALELGWDLNRLISDTIIAMRSCEAQINAFMEDYNSCR